MLQDFRFALRRLRRARLFALGATLILAFGIGANTTALSVVNSFIWQPVKVDRPHELVRVRARTKEGVGRSIPIGALDHLGAADLPFSSTCAYSGGLAPIRVSGQSRSASFGIVSGACMEMLGMRTMVGRSIGPDDAPLRGSGGKVAVLTHESWRHLFGGDPQVVGKTLRIDTMDLTVIGVLAPSLAGLDKDLEEMFFVPFNSYRPGTNTSYIFGRLKPGATLDQANAALATALPHAIEASLASSASAADRKAALDTQVEAAAGANGISTLRNLYGRTFMTLALLTAALTLVAAINVGGLLCSRVAARRHEWAVIRAVGGSRTRIVRELLAESVILAVGACAIGIPLAYVAAPALITLFPVGNLPWTFSLAPDGRVLTIAVATAFALAALMTLVPGWLAARAMNLQSNRTVARGTSRSAHVMLVLQIAATLVLVFGSTLLARSLFTLETTYRGYRGDDIISVRLTQTAGGYTDFDQAAYYPQLADRLASLPGVASIGFARYFGTMPNERVLYTPVHWAGEDDQLTTAAYEYTMPGFFSTLSVPLLYGRDFTWGDAPGATPVTIVSESLARVLSDDGNVVGRYIRFGSDPARQKLQIVGVVGDISFGNPRVRNIRAVFLPGIQANQATYTTAHLKVAGDRAAVVDGLRQTLASMGREQIVVVSSPDGLFINGLSAEWLGATVGSVVAMLALCMACVGIYALLAYAVARRTREIGIRLAIGARPRQVWALITREALMLAAAGAALGIPGALAGAKLIDSLVYGVSPQDPGTLVLSAALLLAIAAMAAAVPAMRAIRVDPMVALRTDSE